MQMPALFAWLAIRHLSHYHQAKDGKKLCSMGHNKHLPNGLLAALKPFINDVQNYISKFFHYSASFCQLHFVVPCKDERIHQLGHIQIWNFDYKRLLNEPYANEVTLRGQQLLLKFCQPLQLLTFFDSRFRSFNTDNTDRSNENGTLTNKYYWN